MIHRELACFLFNVLPGSDTMLQSILNDSDTIGKIIDRQVKSVLESKEVAFMVCRDGSVRDQNTIGEWNDIKVPDFDPGKSCGGKGAVSFHTHSGSSSLPSLKDISSFNKMFGIHPSLKAGCIVGVDGSWCIGRDGKITRKKFTESQEKRFLDESGTKKFIGDDVFCDKISSGKDTKYYCTAQFQGKRERPIGIFDEVSMHGGSVWTGSSVADIAMFSHLPSTRLECFGSTGGVKQLACMLSGRDDR